MDSPIFGNHKKSNQYNQIQNLQQHQNQSTDILLSSNWSILNKANHYKNPFGNSPISTELKMTFTLLVLQKNLTSLYSNINKYINNKKYQAFKNIQQTQFINQSSTLRGQKSTSKQCNKLIKSINNPQNKIYIQISVKQTHQKLTIIYQVIQTLLLKKLAQGFSRILIFNEKNRITITKTDNNNNSSINIVQQTDLGISSKIQSKKHLNSKKHAKQMKQNSLINKNNSDYETENQKLIQQIVTDEYYLERFSAKMNNLLAAHQNILNSDTDRQTRLSENVISQNSFQNNHKITNNGTKSQLYTKKK